jgi:hypothetical protein
MAVRRPTSRSLLVMRNFAAKRSALNSVDIAAFPRVDLKVDAARPFFAFSQPD